MRGEMGLGAIALIWLINTAANAADTVVQCKPPEQRRDAGLAPFSDDDGFDVQVRASPEGAVVRVTGDTVVVDAKRLSSLVAAGGAAKTGLARLTFDARVLRVRGPLSLEGGHLVLLGERVFFEEGGSVALLSSKKPRSLRIAAQTLEFTGGTARPFFIDEADAATAAVPVSIRALQAPAPELLWQRFVDAYVLDRVPPSVSIVTGPAARAEVDKVFSESMEWPLYFAAKLRTHFQRSPYAEETKGEIGRLARSYQPLLATWRTATPVATAVSVASSAANGTDLEGRPQAFTPKEDLISQKTKIQAALKNNSLDSLIALLAASGNDQDAVATRLDETRKALTEARQIAARTDREVHEHGTRLARLDQSKQGLLDRIGHRSEVLRLMSEREAKRMRDAAQVKQWATVAAAAVVIGASMGAASPAVAAGTAAGLNMTGDLVYSHNARTKLTLPQVIERGQKAHANAQAFQAALSELGKAQEQRGKVIKGEKVPKGPPPEEGKADLRPAYTKTEVTFEMLGALGALAQAASKLNSEDLAVPEALSMSDRENQDEEMKGLVAALAAVEKDRAVEAEAAKAAVEALKAASARTVELEELDFQLRTANATNDQEAARWHAAGLVVWARQVERISGMLATYKRSLYFESGRTPVGAAEVLDYPNALQARIATGLLDPFGGIGPEAPAEARRAALQTSRARFLLAAEELHTSIADTYKAYLQTRNEADVYRRVYDFSANSSDPVVRRFMEALNGQIAQQIVGKSPSRSVAPLFIPLKLPASVAGIPERIVSVRVVEARFSVPKAAVGNGALSFIVVHPNYGEMRRDTECFPADFRAKPTDWRLFTTTFEQVDPRWPQRQVASIKIDEQQSNRYYTYLPARAPLHLLIDVVSKNWVALPKLEQISLGLEVMQ